MSISRGPKMAGPSWKEVQSTRGSLYLALLNMPYQPIVKDCKVSALLNLLLAVIKQQKIEILPSA